MYLLNVQRPDFTPRASDFLHQAKELAFKCLEKGFAYYGLVDRKNIYFETEKYLAMYGETFPRSAELPDTVQNDDKKDPRDFALWKSKEWFDEFGNKQSEMPGWHTECAAMTADHFGKYLDIHLGGVDLKFPHHENEIALRRVFSDEKNWVRFCLYTGHLQIEGCKMSKSLKNFVTVRDMIEEGFHPLALRYFFMKYPYYKPINFKREELRKAQKSYDNFMHHLQIIKQYLVELKDKKENNLNFKSTLSQFNELKEEIDCSLLNNLNVSKALQALENYVQALSTKEMKHLSYSWLKYILNYVLWVTDKYFGLIERGKEENKSNELFLILKEFRSNVRQHALNQKKIFDLCDDLRQHVMNNRNQLLEFCDNVRHEVKRLNYVAEDD